MNRSQVVLNIRIYLNLLYGCQWRSLELHSSDNAVPVALRLVGYTMRVLAHIDGGIQPVVNADRQVMFSGAGNPGKVIFMGCHQAVF